MVVVAHIDDDGEGLAAGLLDLLRSRIDRSLKPYIKISINIGKKTEIPRKRDRVEQKRESKERV